MLKILINGLTTQTDALVAAKLGANGLGFVLDQHDKRYIEFTLARQIIQQLSPMVVPYITPHNFEPDILKELAVKLTAGAIILPVEYYTKDFHALSCSIVIRGNRDTLSPVLAQSSRKLHAIVDDLPVSALPELSQGDQHLWKKFNQEHHLFLPCDVDPEDVLDAIEPLQPAALYFEGASESHTGLQDWPKIQRYVQAIQQIVERV